VNTNTLVAILMALLKEREGEEYRIPAEELDRFSHDLRHVVMVQPLEEEGVRYIVASISERPGFQLGTPGLDS